jgi:hypothetical protein
LLDQILSAEAAVGGKARELSGPVVGSCVDARHPTLTGRVLVRYTVGTETHQLWLSILQGVTVRAGDLVLLMQPGNWPEPLVVGVMSGFAPGPEAAAHSGSTITLQRDEALQIVGPTGNRLVEIVQNDAGPVVRLLSDAVQLDAAGALNIKADSINLEATAGEIRIKASDDVVVQGDVIHLN